MKRMPRVQAKNKRKTRYESIPKGRQTGREHGDGGDSKSRGKVQPEGNGIYNHGRRCAEHTEDGTEKHQRLHKPGDPGMRTMGTEVL